VETELPPEPSPEPESRPNTAQAPVFALPVASMEAASVPPSSPYTDRSTGLMIFGVIQIILGLLAALFVPLMALGAFLSHLTPGAGKMRPGQFIGVVGIYGAIAVVFLCLGIGSVQTKRWARALTLVTSWYWLIAGALMTVLLTAVLPVMMQRMLRVQQSATSGPGLDTSTGVVAIILTLVIVFAAFFLVVLPIAFVVFYSRSDVADTCRHRDPVERWTDRTPLPVLGASVVFTMQAISLLVAGVSTPMFPFFGRYLSGFAAFACFVLVTALDAYLAIAIFRLRSGGWWLAIIMTPVRLISMALTIWRADLGGAYAKIGWSEQQLDALNSNPILRSRVLLWWSLLSAIIFYGYLISLKRYFKTQTPPQIEALPAQAG
jgi:hypothetical protein